jgi:hypothetical protein
MKPIVAVRMHKAVSSGSSPWWALSDMTMHGSTVEISEVELYVGASKQTISAISVQGPAGTYTVNEAELIDGSVPGGGLSGADTMHSGIAIVCQLSAAATIDGIKLGATAVGARVPRAVGVYRSLDSGSTWELYGIAHFAAVTNSTLSSLVTINVKTPSAAAHRYWRLYALSYPYDIDAPESTELQLFEGATRRDSGATWTSNATVSSMSNLNDSDGTTKPTLDTAANMMASTTYLGIDLGAAYAIDGFKAAPDNRFFRHISGFAVYYSDDNSTFTFQKVVRNITYPGQRVIPNVRTMVDRAAMAFANCRWSTTDKNSGTSVSLTDRAGSVAVRSNNAPGKVRATPGKSSGVWYWEVSDHMHQTSTSTTSQSGFGIREASESIDTAYDAGNTIVLHLGTGTVTVGSSGATAASGDACNPGDCVGFKLDVGAGTLHAWRNGVAMNGGSAIATGIPSGTWHPFAHVGSSSSFDAYVHIFSGAGQQNFDCPSGALPMTV